MKTLETEDMGPQFSENEVTGMRKRFVAEEGDKDLGPLRLLPGTWGNIRVDDRADDGKDEFAGMGNSPLDGRGWNLIALPFHRAAGGPPYRVMMNQYNEILDFDFVDDRVPNRGIGGNPLTNTDQRIVALDYTQRIRQIAAADDGPNGDGLAVGADIHHEPGFFLHMQKPHQIDRFSIARLATIPHGNAANAIGKHKEFKGPPTIPDLSGLPEGASTFDIQDEMLAGDKYMAPYFRFSEDNSNPGEGPFKGTLDGVAGFRGFFPENANFLLQLGLSGIADKVVRTTELVLDTDTMEAGIVNIPFITRQADAALMRSTFWIMELDEPGPFKKPRLILAYSQFIFLDFFARRDGRDGFIRWPHISINFMEKIAP